ncbi:MAG: DEAD/DEAH box helicase [Calditrichaeota bacterium]|nr:MAG: DEAD/DEAH box helicase [Calditrichota bacterium]
MSDLESFRVLGLSEETLKTIKHKGFEEPTPIQEKVIPLLLHSDKDIVGQAQTGTGKTAAFGLPLLERINPSAHEVKAIVLTPTRELTIQVAEELASMRGKKKLKIAPVYGGQSMELQMRHLREGVHIVVGTPGRIMDHLRRKTLKIDHLDYFILDEADEMLNMGFLEDVQEILKYTNTDKRNLLFSATMPAEILQIAKTQMGPYEMIKVQDQQLTVEQTDQIYFQVSEANKFEALCRIIDYVEDFYGLIFCRTKNDSDQIAHRLLDRGYDAEALHGDLSQIQREKVMNKFKKRWVNILVATDVAARGIDVSDLTHVINFSLPHDPEAYVHRIGRTGRAGKEGTAVTFITPSEEKKLLIIERKTKAKIRREKLPQIKEIIEAKQVRIQTEVENMAVLDDLTDYVPLAQDLLRGNDAELVLAAVLKYAFEEELDPAHYNELRSEQPKPHGGQTRLFIARGHKDQMTPKKLIRMITEETHIPPKKIQEIRIQEEFSFMTVPFREAEMILKHFNRGKKGKKPLVEVARPKE